MSVKKLFSPYLLWPIVIFLWFFLYLYFLKVEKLQYDAQEYWENGKLFYKSGKFSLLNYSNTLRGYFLPLFYLPGHTLELKFGLSPIEFSKLVGALTAALIYGYTLPKLWEITGERNILHWSRRALFAFIGFSLWSDYFAFPLSDFPAILALSLCLILIIEKPTIFKLTAAGFLFAAAINIRPMYLIISPIILGMVFFSGGKIQIRYIHKHLVPFLLGFWIVSVPQFIINYQNQGILSPFVKSEYKQRDLYLTQLEWGINIQKHETNVGESYPSPHMFFFRSCWSSDHGKGKFNNNTISWRIFKFSKEISC